ncbi:hypothetical protein NEOLEDRAFT_1176223 [Neolentinus lepideus HHB14362 ss-1]|uniref:F-box domain-containing protein n=1 Tax=Neolentinus lepideus HHB14362 ss-1 TaxID=1314782 RepID=A0A165UF87_9AGAM|nr:hypothetical protein NEOLEDRAFT_1176223 [Neolentinus lepideus HHB14362 ss-1]
MERQHLIWIALTCKTFLDPALDILWSRIDSLTPLLKLLRGFQWAGDFYILTGHVSSDDLGRFERYANSVRELEYRRDEYLHSSIFHRLLATRSAPLLPNLRVLNWDDADPSSLEPFFLLSPSLERVEIKLAYSTKIVLKEDHALQAFICALMDKAPSLQHFAFSGALRRNYLQCLPMLAALRSVKLIGKAPLDECEGPIALTTPHMYYNFSILEHLTSLDIDVDGLQTFYDLHYYQFPALSQLRLSGNLSIIMSALDTISTGRLTRLALYFANTKPHDLPALFLQISRRFPQLTGLTVHAAMPSFRQLVEQLIFTDVLGSLLSLGSLQDVDMELENVALVMNNNDAASLAAAWPLLRTFSCHYSAVPNNDSPTLWCLLAFAYHCPLLLSLSMHVRMRMPPANTWEPPRVHGLKTIDLLEWPSDYIDVTQTAMILDRLFQKLDLATIMDESWRSSTWKAVFQAMLQRRSAWHVRDGTLHILSMPIM